MQLERPRVQQPARFETLLAVPRELPAPPLIDEREQALALGRTV